MEPQKKFRDGWKTWSPNQLDKNSNPQGLLRADNLIFRKQGGVSRCQNPTQISSGAFAATANALYSTDIRGPVLTGITSTYAKLRYVSANGSVYRNYTGGTPTESDFSATILSGGSSGYCAFGEAWGEVILCSGSVKRVDSGNSQRDLGFGVLSAPTVSRGSKEEINLSSLTGFDETNYVGVEFDAGGFSTNADYVYVKSQADTFRAVAQCPDFGSDKTANLANFTRGDGPNDLFSMNLRLGDTSKVFSVRVELLLETPTVEPTDATTTPDTKNFFWFEWINGVAVETTPDLLNPDIYGYSDRENFIKDVQANITPGVSFSNFFREAENAWGVVECLRGQFKRVGSDSSKDWNAIKGIRVILKGTEQTTLYFATPKFISGNGPGINQGYYKYVQVQVRREGQYLQIGLPSAASSEIQLIREPGVVTPSSPTGAANEVWIYRASTQSPGYYRVKVLTSGTGYGVFTDEMSDLDALKEERLEDYRSNVPDDVRFIVGPVFDRVLYFSESTMYPSYKYDFGSYDSRFPSQIASVDGEKILWVKVVSDYYIVVGTTKDIYIISGDFSYDENLEILNFTVKGIGTDQPPINSACTSYGTTIIYLSALGWTKLEGTSVQLLTEMPNLYYGEDCHGIEKLSNPLRDDSTVSAAVGSNRLYISAQNGSQGRHIHVFDFQTQAWEFRKFASTAEPLHLFAETDGTIIYSTTAAGDDYLYKLEGGTGSTLAVTFRTIIDTLDFPTNRKDFSSLKISGNFAYTGSPTVAVTMKEGVSAATYTSNFTLNSTSQTSHYNLGILTEPMKGVQVEITGNFTQFDLHFLQFDFTPRPAQETFLYIPETNLGEYGLKHISTLPFVLDTLGQSVDVIPILDGVQQAAQSFTTSAVNTCAYQFTTAKSAELIGMILKLAAGSYHIGFEFYEMLKPVTYHLAPGKTRYIEEKPNNLGTANRKRFNYFYIRINTGGNNVTVTPYIDNVAQTAFTVNSAYAKSIPCALAADTIGVDIAFTISGANLFEYYGIEWKEGAYEVLPPEIKAITFSEFLGGTFRRKKISSLPIIIDTKGQNVTLTLTARTQSYSGTATNALVGNFTINTNGKLPYLAYFDEEVICSDLTGSLLGSTTFNFYGVNEGELAYEVLPPSHSYMVCPSTNLNTQKVKRINVLAFKVDTHGQNVTFTPKFDGVAGTPVTVNTNYPQTFRHQLTAAIEATDIDGTMDGTIEFEWYGWMIEECVFEALPPMIKVFDTNFTNFGDPRKKRLRTWPFQIDTNGQNVNVVGYAGTTAKDTLVVNTSELLTKFYYFDEDVFDVDYKLSFGGALSPEFRLGQIHPPEIVEILPVGKVLDQIGPFDQVRGIEIFMLRVSLYATGTTVNFAIYSDDTSILTGAITTVANKLQPYEIKMPIGVNVRTCRIELSATTEFHRTKTEIKVSDPKESNSENKWVTL